MTIMKSKEILDLVEKLELDVRGWRIVDHWEADLCAIGVAKASAPGRLVYVSTYEKELGRYDFECEISAGENLEDYITTETGDGVDFATLLAVMERHLC